MGVPGPAFSRCASVLAVLSGFPAILTPWETICWWYYRRIVIPHRVARCKTRCTEPRKFVATCQLTQVAQKLVVWTVACGFQPLFLVEDPPIQTANQRAAERFPAREDGACKVSIGVSSPLPSCRPTRRGSGLLSADFFGASPRPNISISTPSHWKLYKA